jgi:hypothetical protein
MKKHIFLSGMILMGTITLESMQSSVEEVRARQKVNFRKKQFDNAFNKRNYSQALDALDGSSVTDKLPLNAFTLPEYTNYSQKLLKTLEASLQAELTHQEATSDSSVSSSLDFLRNNLGWMLIAGALTGGIGGTLVGMALGLTGPAALEVISSALSSGFLGILGLSSKSIKEIQQENHDLGELAKALDARISELIAQQSVSVKQAETQKAPQGWINWVKSWVA